MKLAFAFDESYYARYYRNARTRVTDASDARRVATFLAGYMKFLDQPVRNIVDLGCGLGQLRKPLLSRFSGASYLGVERSTYACEQHGFALGSVVDYKPKGRGDQRFDLVICKGVLQYLDAREAALALANLGRLCRGCLYLEALTQEDWISAADQKLTDGAVYMRPARFYRQHLRAQFKAAGGGIFVHERSPAVLYALETL
jgi:SAM-dependent methyltransferase